jgi:membrane protease YdiL (CAAX protease family)
MVPILIVVSYEQRSLVSLGLASGRLSKHIYIGLVFAFIVLPPLLLGLDRGIIFTVLEQVLFIAFAEELLWRGYLQKRLSDWIGLHRGILLSSFVFGLGHLVSIHAVEGYLIPRHSFLTLAQTSIGGLIFGYLFAWSKSIWPGAILHLFGNAFFSYIS